MRSNIHFQSTIFLGFFMVFILVQCSSSGGMEIPSVDFKPSAVQAADNYNAGNASDIEVSFLKPAELDQISGFGVIVIRDGEESALTSASFKNLPAERVEEIAKNANPVNIRLRPGLKDYSGNPIEDGISYRVIVFSIVEGSGEIFSASPPFTLSRTHLVTTLAGNVPGGTGGMDIDKDGWIYTADFGQTLQGPPGNRVTKVNPETGQFSVFATGFNGASGNFIDPKGNYYQSNIQGGTLTLIDPQLNASTIATGLSGPVGILKDSNGNIYIAECNGNKISKVTGEGVYSVVNSDPLLSCPNGITTDNQGNLYIANFSNGRVLKLDLSSNHLSVLANLSGGNNGHLVYQSGSLYVIDRGAHQIVKVSLNGDIEIVAGSGLRGHRNGNAISATFSHPNDLIFSQDGKKIYVNEVLPLDGPNLAPTTIRVIELFD